MILGSNVSIRFDVFELIKTRELCADVSFYPKRFFFFSRCLVFNKHLRIEFRESVHGETLGLREIQ